MKNSFENYLCIAQDMCSSSLHILKKAESYQGGEDEILAARLAPDMFPFSKQIYFVGKNIEMAFWSLGFSLPELPGEYNNIEELKQYIEQIQTYLQDLKNIDWEEYINKEIRFSFQPWVHQLWEEYLLHFAIPNTLFHCVSAYNILRNNGIEIGKMDFLRNLKMYPDAQ